MAKLGSKIHQHLRHPLALRVLNSLAFYGVWTALVVTAAQGNAWHGLTIMAAWTVVHMLLSQQKHKEVIFLSLVAALGAVLDSVYVLTGVLTFASPNLLAPWLSPLWMLAVYVLYGMAIDYSLFWLRDRLWLAALFGACGSIASYRVGVAVGAAEFLVPNTYGLAIVGCVWALYCPLTCWLSKWVDRRLGLDEAKGNGVYSEVETPLRSRDEEADS